MSTVVVVRPYSTRLRERVFTALHRAGITVRISDVIPRGATDEQVIASLRTRRPSALVLPFHAHLDVEGHSVNGLKLAERIDAELPHLRSVPIVMPTSLVALPAARLRIDELAANSALRPVAQRILVVDDRLLDAHDMLPRLTAHLARVA